MFQTEDVAERLRSADLAALGITEADRRQVGAAVAALSGDDLRRIAATADRLADRVGRIDGMAPGFFDDLPDEPGRPRGVLALLALIATTAEVRAAHAARGISPEESASGLADLGQQLSVHRLVFGEFGLHTQNWMTVAWSGAMFWLGRLQFNILPRPAGATTERDWVISTHIPRTGGLDPAAVDDAFARAADFFGRHFADHPADHFHCDSWLLDPQLAARLAPAGNMATFQRRWTLFGEGVAADEDPMFFVFNRRPPLPDPATLPRETSLQRAIVDHWAAGGHWSRWQGLAGLAGAGPRG